MSKLTELIGQVAKSDPTLAEELRKEFEVYAKRRPFGLNFERHMPESVRLYNRQIRRGDRVNVLPERGKREKAENKRIWRVDGFKTIDGEEYAETTSDDQNEDAGLFLLENLVVVMQFQEPIYPGLEETGRVARGGDKPYQVVINGENYHALETLLYAYEGKVDCIYIDPPYNTGAKDWKYNNDYVDSEDAYRHSKWLAFMERRLKLAKRLLNPEESVLIVTIDEKEVHRLGLLLSQVFSGARVQLISSVINPKGTSRVAEFSRTDEYVFFVMIGAASPQSEEEGETAGVTVEWGTLRRRDLTSVRKTRPAQFYPIYVEIETGRIIEIGDAIPHDQDRNIVLAKPGCETVWPIRPDGTEMNWGVTAPSLRERLSKGYVRIGKHEPQAPQKFVVTYLKTGPISDIEEGRAEVISRGVNGDVEARYLESKTKLPTTNWQRPSHSGEQHGSVLLRELIPKRRFPFPKSLYAVEDCLRFFIMNKPQALIVDFFSGSGTTAHAVMRLNHQDSGQRCCICITNNEVSASEQKFLTEKNLRQGDPEWEELGICEYITKPRVTAAITGRTLDGEPIKGDYKFTDEFPMADGFEENAVFYNLTYQDEANVELDQAFSEIAPLLWMRVGSQGRCISERKPTFDIAERYAVLFDYRAANSFLKALDDAPGVGLVYIVTNQDSRFQDVAQRLPEGVESVRLYESYLRSFKINQGEA